MVDPNNIHIDTDKLSQAYNESHPALVRRPKIEIIIESDLKKLEDKVNIFLLEKCTLRGFEFHGFDWKKRSTTISYTYVGTVSYSYLKELGKGE